MGDPSFQFESGEEMCPIKHFQSYKNSLGKAKRIRRKSRSLGSTKRGFLKIYEDHFSLSRRVSQGNRLAEPPTGEGATRARYREVAGLRPRGRNLGDPRRGLKEAEKERRKVEDRPAGSDTAKELLVERLQELKMFLGELSSRRRGVENPSS